MHPLMLHRTCDLGPIRAITAAIVASESGCNVEFRIEGNVGAIKLPASAPSRRADNLWQTTCFEFFWQPIGGRAYREFNLSPSGLWAAYDFDSYREGMQNAPVDAIAVSCAASDTEFVLRASIVADLPDPAQVGLTAVIEHADGALQYWSLAFPPGKPDFHSEACRQLIVER
jgi:hypothetical protein